MEIIGIIVEYNPLHNGHVHHFKSIKEKYPDSLVVAVMSSSIVNRGEIAVFTKFDRASMALSMGADLILELPSVYAYQSADVFAYRATSILNYIGAKKIIIGSETNDPSIYDKYLAAINNPLYDEKLRDFMSNGLSYKMASNLAFKEFKLDELKSNDMLGLSYYKAIKNNSYDISLETIKRQGNDYLDKDSSSSMSSASAIRECQDNIEAQVPKYVYSVYKEKGFIDNNQIFSFLKLNILNGKLDEMFLIEEGFNNSLSKVYKYNDLKSFLESLNTKRYTNTRIKRMLTSVLFNIKKDEMNIINKMPTDFVRVLGYNECGKEYISKIKKDKNIITNIKNGINDILDIEIRISKIIDTIYNLNLFNQEQKGPTKM